MDACCNVRTVPRAQRRVLHVVFWINLGMFIVEAAAGLLAHSTALLADSGDMLGDAVVYGFSLYVVDRGIVWKARAALLKGLVMGSLAVGVLVQVGVTLSQGLVPVAETMGAIGGLALGANLVCLGLLWGRRADDINMRSAWLCSRNDVIGNLGVLVGAVAVRLSGSAWPDIAIGLVVAAIVCRSAISVVRSASVDLRAASTVLPARRARPPRPPAAPRSH